LLRALLGQFGRVCLSKLDKSLGSHSHKDFHVILSQDGEGLLFDVENSQALVSAESALAIDTWVCHSYEHQPDDSNKVVMALHLEPQWLMEWDRKTDGQVYRPFYSGPCIPLNEQARYHSDVLFQHMSLDDSPSSSKVEGLIIGFLRSLSDACAFQESSAKLLKVPVDARIRRAVSVIRSWNGSYFSLDELLETTGLSKARFFRLFKVETGLTPNSYFNTLRMEQAVREVALSSRNLEAIASDLGFESAANFTRFFRDQIGMAPSEYRKAVEVL